MRPHTPEQSLDLGRRVQQLKHTIRGDDQIEAAAQRKLGDIAEFCPRSGRGQACSLQLLAAAREHGRGAIDTVDRAARSREREQDTTRPAPQFQHRRVCRWQTLYRKRDHLGSSDWHHSTALPPRPYRPAWLRLPWYVLHAPTLHA